MATKRIYREDQYAASCRTVVTDVLTKDGHDVITCSESVFYPEGGGQPSDIGTVSLGNELYEIIHASDESIDGDVWHLTDAPAGTFGPGDEIELAIDYDFRFKNMQRHLGEHILSGILHSLFGGINKGFHIGDDYVTIDIDLEGRMLTEDEIDLTERSVNEAVWADLPVTTEWFDTYEDSLVRPVRKKVPHDGKVSVVTVGDLTDPYDCIACCGVHPARSSEVGLLAIYKCESNKGMNRIYFDCGAAARERLSRDFHILRSIAESRSCHPEDVPARLAAEAENVSSLKANLSELSAYVRESEKNRILAEQSGSSFFAYSSDLLSVNDLLKLGFSIINEVPDLLLAIECPAALTCLLFSSGDLKCGEIIKELAPKFGGKGGGKSDNARAIFTNNKDMKEFINAIKAAGDY